MNTAAVRGTVIAKKSHSWLLTDRPVLASLGLKNTILNRALFQEQDENRAYVLEVVITDRDKGPRKEKHCDGSHAVRKAMQTLLQNNTITTRENIRDH